ncbi:MAG TPA: hypothetical protein VMM60_12055 [Ilumatobacter sp.]|nr:hypothetical protein [Ilumatobacter sp.]
MNRGDSATDDATDRWFVHRGLPHAMPHYSASEDIWTRTWPFLLLVMFVELFATFGDRYDGWKQFGVFIGGLGVIIGAFVLVNVLRRRPAFRLPDSIAAPELTVFVLVPALVPWFLSSHGWRESLVMAGINLGVLAVAFVVTSYGLLPAMRCGLVQSAQQLRTVVQLVARGIPLLLLITAFMFLNAEMWQVADNFTPLFFAFSIGFMVLAAMSFLTLRVPREVAALARFDSWDDAWATARKTDAPIVAATAPGRWAGAPAEPELGRVELVNVGLLLTAAQMVQTLLVGTCAGVFYVGFGMVAVRRDTVLAWTVTDRVDTLLAFELGGGEIVLTWQHIAVAGFIAAFSVLQFAVSSVTDETYRNEFYDDVARDVREVLAVRAIVRHERAEPSQ